jgi:hypothetical protein
MGSRMHSYPIYQEYQKRAEPLGEVLARRLADASIAIDNQTERIDIEMVSGNYFTMLGVGRRRPRLQFAGRRSGLPGSPVGRDQLRLLDAAIQSRPARDRQEDPRQQLPDDDRRRVGGGFAGIDPARSPQMRVPILMKPAIVPSGLGAHGR